MVLILDLVFVFLIKEVLPVHFRVSIVGLSSGKSGTSVDHS